MDSYNSKSIKTKSSVKSDIRIVIHDSRTGTNPELGFSIKSQLGKASTLLNASMTTNFIYRLVNQHYQMLKYKQSIQLTQSKNQR